MVRKNDMPEVTPKQVDVIDNLRQRNQVLRHGLQVILKEQPVSPELVAEKALRQEAEIGEKI